VNKENPLKLETKKKLEELLHDIRSGVSEEVAVVEFDFLAERGHAITGNKNGLITLGLESIAAGLELENNQCRQVAERSQEPFVYLNHDGVAFCRLDELLSQKAKAESGKELESTWNWTCLFMLLSIFLVSLGVKALFDYFFY